MVVSAEGNARVAPAQRPTKTRPDTRVGQLLTEARRRHNISIEDASAALKIPQRQLQGLEDGDLSVFPAEVYARGAFTAYAQHLGIQTQRTQREFQRALTGAREYVPLRVHTPQSWLAALWTPRWLLVGAGVAAAVVVGSYVAWQVSGFVALPELSLSQPVSAVSSATSVTVSGRAATDATVTVNEVQVVVDDAGRFAMDMGLHEGVNVVEIAATNAAGRTRTLRKDILVPRQ